MTQLGPAVVGGTVYFNVVTSAAGNLHVWIDEDIDTDFVDQDANQQDFVISGAGTTHIAVDLNSAIAGSPYFRFIFEEGTNLVIDPNTNYSATVVNGEIEDYSILVVENAAVSMDAEIGGVTTTVDANGSDVEVTSGGDLIFSAPLSKVTSITVNGDNAADDSFVLDLDNGDPIPAAGLTFNGQGQASSDVLTIEDNASNTTVTHTFTNANDGMVEVDDGIISYTGLEPITDNVPTAARVFTFTGSADTISMTEAGGAGDDVIEIDSDNSEKVTFDVSITATIVINAGGGADDISIDVLDSVMASLTTVTVNGGTSGDELHLDLASDGVLAGADLVFNGDDGADKLNLLNNSYSTLTVDYDAGTVDVGLGNDITFVSVPDIDVDLTIDDYVFDLTSGVDTATLGDDSGAADGESQISDGTLDVIFNNPTTSITVNGLGGDDDLTVGFMDSAAAHQTDVNGDADNDDFELDFRNGNPLDAGDINWDGGAGTNTWLLDNGATFTTVTHDFDVLEVDVDAATGDFSYTSSPTGEDDLEATNKVFNLTTGPDTVDFTDVGTSTDDQSEVADGTVTIVYRNADTAETVNGLGDDEDVTLEILDTNFTGTFTFNGGDDNDTFIVDWVNGSPISGPTVTYNGDGQSVSDDLVLDDGPGIASVTHFYDNANDGTVTVDGSTMTYTGLEPIDDNLTAATRTFTFDSTDDDIVLDVEVGGTDSEISSASSSEVTVFDHSATTTVVINGGAGDDDFDVEPSEDHAITANGQTESAADTFRLNSGPLVVDSDIKITLTESDNENGVYSFTDAGAFLDVTYTDMEIVTMRLHDPNAFSGSTYEQDAFYPLIGESGISIEPYFNWDIDQMNLGPAPSIPTALEIEVATNNTFLAGVIVFESILQEDGATALYLATGSDDHYITDIDNQPQDDGIPLLNDTTYYWRLQATLTSGNIFCHSTEHYFTTINELEPTLDYPDDELTVYTLDFIFQWNVASPAQDDVYWRVDLDKEDAASFDGATPSEMGGDAENDDDTAAADGFADETEFDTDDLGSALLWGTTYSWRASAMWPAPPTGWVPQEIFDLNETDRMVSFSDVSEFSTVTKALVPTLTYPINAMTIYNIDPILSWNVAGPFAVLTFELTIKEDGGADACVAGAVVSGISGLQYDTSNCTSPLEAGETYEWFVTSTDGTNTSAASATETFSIQGNGFASASFPSYPVDLLEIYTTAPTFHWFTASAATGLTFVAWYKLRAGAAETTCTDVKAGGTDLASVSVTQVDVSGLEPGATYDWCVVTTGTNGSFDSDVEDFIVAGGAGDGIPIASFPTGNPTTYTLDQVVHWYVEGASLGITDFTVEYCLDPEVFDGACTIVAGITENQYEIAGLDYGDIVIWRVKASYSSGSDSDWTVANSQGSFTVTGDLNSLSAVLSYPVGGLIVYTADVQLNWYVLGATLPSGAMTFEVTWSYAETFPTIGSVTSTATTTNPYHDITDLIPGHTYWWKVKISLDGGTEFGSYTTAESFEVAPGASAVMPRLGSPTRTIAVATASPTLSWLLPTQSSSVLTFDLLVGTESDLTGAISYEELTAANYRLTDLAAGTYFWAVPSNSTDGTTSAYSSIASFVSGGSISTGIETVDDPADDISDDATDDDDERVEDPTEQIVPTDFDLGQNYPNPFNPTTTIEFKMAEAANVSIRVFNVLGQVVRTLVSGTLPPGLHRVSWDSRDDSGTSVVTGLYLYRIETESYTSVKTLVLMK